MKNMTVSVSTHPQHPEITLLSAKGFIDSTTAPEFDRAFQSVLGENRYKIVVDFKNVTYVSSAGWGLFVGEIKRIRTKKGDLFFASMSPEVSETYELLEFDSILKAFPSVEEAVQKGFGKPLAVVPSNDVRKGRGGRAKAGSTLEVSSPVSLIPESTPVSATPVVSEPVETTGGAFTLVENRSTPASSKKTNWFLRIWMPWKWF